MNYLDVMAKFFEIVKDTQAANAALLAKDKAAFVAAAKPGIAALASEFNCPAQLLAAVDSDWALGAAYDAVELVENTLAAKAAEAPATAAAPAEEPAPAAAES